MFDKMFDEFGSDPRFMEVMKSITKDIVLDISNDLKFNKVDVEEPIVGAIALISLQEFSFVFLRSLNMALNGVDANKMGDVNEFIDKLEAIYFKAEEHKKLLMNKEF